MVECIADGSSEVPLIVFGRIVIHQAHDDAEYDPDEVALPGLRTFILL